MENIKIVHISDLHMSEHLTEGAAKYFKAPHRYGHDVKAFLALDDFLKKNDWDLLLITGDISRIGNVQSFEYVRNWLESELYLGANCVGLGLNRDDSRHYVVIPGNHDRFNGGLVQGSLENYNHEFPVIRSGSCDSFYIKGLRVNVHLYDSTQGNSSFAYGYLEDSCLVPKELDGNLNIALLHHHFIQPPKQKREAATELMNSSDVAAYFLNSGFDGIFFGHTHQGYIGSPSVKVLSGILPDKRRITRFIKRLLPKYFLRKIDGDCLVSYKRVSARNGQLPTLDSYFNYLYLKRRAIKVKSPECFNTIKEFYNQLDVVLGNESLVNEIEDLKSSRILISLAPSVCQDEAKWKGFHTITFNRDEQGKYSAEWERYQFNGSKFIKR